MKTQNKETARVVIEAERLWQILIVVVGIVAIIAGAIITETVASSALIGIGCSLVPSGIISLIDSRLIMRRFDEKNIREEWGLSGIYETRAEMNKSCDKYLQKCHEHLDMVGFGFRSLRDSQSQLIEMKVRSGLKIRILSPDPKSQYLKQREKDENVSGGEIATSIAQLDKWVEHLRSIAPCADNVQIKHYKTLPLDFYFRTDNHIFTGPYEIGKLSQHTISYEYSGDGQGFDYYTGYFDSIWNSDIY